MKPLGLIGFFLIAGLICTAGVAWGRGHRHPLRELRNLPMQACSYRQVGPLVIALVESHPGNAKKYFLIARKRLGRPGYVAGLITMGKTVNQIVNRSSLSPAKKRSITRTVNKLTFTEWGGPPPTPPDPTPSPTP